MQLADILRDRIKRRELSGRIPSINELAETYELSPATVKRTLGILTDEGLIHEIRGRGTFVSEQR